MSQLHLLLSFVELAAILIFGLCVFYSYNRNWNFWTRVGTAVLVVLINIVQLVIEIKLERNFALSFLMIFLWGINLCGYYSQFKRRKFLRK